ncbi:hypothetical protein Esti_001337 [Eimeria stiedai]
MNKKESSHVLSSESFVVSDVRGTRLAARCTACFSHETRWTPRSLSSLPCLCRHSVDLLLETMAVLGIDLGTQNSVLATINRGAVSVVRTELADRLTPSLVLFSQGHRLMGDHAAPLVRSQAKACCRSFKNLLGELYADSPRVTREKRFQLAEIAEAHGGLAGFKVVIGDKEETLSASRVCAAFLTKLKQVAELSTQRPVGEVVIACPSWFREANREALLDAAEIAGLTCLRVISDMTATALDYGLYRRQHFTDAKTIVAFVSVGHATASVFIASFTSAGAEVLAEVSNPDLGGRDMDFLIAQHFAGVFEKQHGVNPLENVKAKLKLEDQAERTKKVLSANSETTFAVECLMEEQDISGLITRELFEELCADSFKPALVKLLHQGLSLSGLEPADIAFVEAVGGCTRIPWVQRCISEAFGKEISRTLAGDECVARGCALQAAMASLHFKVKEFDFGEKLWHPIKISWSGEAPVSVSACTQQQQQQEQQQQQQHADSPVSAAAASSASGCQEIELPIGSPTNTLRKITFLRDSSFELRVAYKDLGRECRAADLGKFAARMHALLHACTHVSQTLLKPIMVHMCTMLLLICCSSVAAAVAAGGCRVELPAGCGPREVHVFCAVNYNGLIRFPRACMKSLETTTDAAGAAAAAAGGAEAAPAAAAAADPQQDPQQQQQEAVEGEKSSKAKPVELHVEPLLYAGRLSEQERRFCREWELQMINEDRLHREKQDRMNELETSVYATRDGLSGPLSEFACEGEKATLSKLLEELEAWVYDHQGDPEITKSAIVAKIDALKQVASPIQYRQQQKQLRCTAAEQLRKAIQECREAATGGSPDFAHIPAHKMQQLVQAAEADEAWITRVMREAEAQPLSQDPSVTAEAIDQRRMDLAALGRKILSTPKPKQEVFFSSFLPPDGGVCDLALRGYRTLDLRPPCLPVRVWPVAPPSPPSQQAPPPPAGSEADRMDVEEQPEGAQEEAETTAAAEAADAEQQQTEGPMREDNAAA